MQPHPLIAPVKTAASSAADKLIAALNASGEPRVWSLIISIFGDAVAPRGGEVSAAALGAMTGRIGIKPQALRVALSRLARDGWISRSRQGRNSFYQLSPRGLETFAPASRRIYATAPMADPGHWQVLVSRPEDNFVSQKARVSGFTAIAPQLHIRPSPADTSDLAELFADCIIIEGELAALPAWVRESVGAPDLATGFEQLQRSLRQVATQLDNALAEPLADPLGAAAIRVLIIHHWRRLLLRQPDLPMALFPDHWPGENCRTLVLQLHARLSPAADRWLDGMIGNGMATAAP